MFKVVKDRTVSRKVIIRIPREGEGTQQATVNVKFLILTEAELEKYDRNSDDDRLALLKRVIKDWGTDVVDEDGNVIPCNDEGIEKALTEAFARLAFVKSYFDMVYAAEKK